MSHKILSSVNVYVLNGTKVLLSRRANTGWRDGDYCAPGGHVEEGETPIIAMVREIEEELTVKIDPNDLEFCCVAMRRAPDREYAAFEFIIRDKKYKFENGEPEKCSELSWFELTNLPENLIEDFRDIINNSILGDSRYLELGY